MFFLRMSIVLNVDRLRGLKMFWRNEINDNLRTRNKFLNHEEALSRITLTDRKRNYVY